MGCSFLRSVRVQHVPAQCGVVNGLGDSSNTMHVKLHEFFDRSGVAQEEHSPGGVPWTIVRVY
jgi:hypothetical protein